jgi:hypothetical protein
MTREKGRQWDGRSRPPSDLYKKNFDEIFKKKEEKENDGSNEWGIPELHLKNKAKRHQFLIYQRAMEHASRLTDQNKQKLIEELQKGMQKDHGSV